jgi:DNA modification methylase
MWNSRRIATFSFSRRISVRAAPNENDIVFDPFGGIGSSPVMALEMRRKAVAVELKDSYYRQMKSNCELAAKSEQLDMFEDIEIAE